MLLRLTPSKDHDLNDFQVKIVNILISYDMNLIEGIEVDFTHIKRIHLQVITRFLSLAHNYKTTYDKLITINFGDNEHVYGYLEALGFFRINKELNLFNVECESIVINYHKKYDSFYVLSYTSMDRLESKYRGVLKFSDRVSEKTRLKICLEHEIFGTDFLDYLDKNKVDTLNFYNLGDESLPKSYVNEYLKVFSNFLEDLSKIELVKLMELAHEFIELVHNAVYHGRTICFFGLQTHKPDMTRAIIMSVADAGKGYYESLYKQLESEGGTYIPCLIDRPHFLAYSERIEEATLRLYSTDNYIGLDHEAYKIRLSQEISELRNQYISRNTDSIFEALLFRMGIGVRGLYDTLEEVSHFNNLTFVVEDGLAHVTMNQELVDLLLNRQNHYKAKDSIVKMNSNINQEKYESFVFENELTLTQGVAIHLEFTR